MRTTEPETTREAVALFKRADALQDAIDELLSSGFDRAELSLLATEDALKLKFGDRFKRSDQLEDADDVPRCCYLSPESLGDAQGGIIGGLVYVGAVAATGLVIVGGGPLAAAIAAAIVAGGAAAAVGSILAARIGETHALHTAEHLEHGGLLLWVRTWNQEDENRATAILRKHSGLDVHVHGSPAAA
jgi:hypothetical protein